ncbi:MAG: hypothetical protein M0Q95_21705, partial [Porticoccaceae bacterium]|nr:hypothetical protein [Porticoccaceae bacterium]
IFSELGCRDPLGHVRQLVSISLCCMFVHTSSHHKLNKAKHNRPMQKNKKGVKKWKIKKVKKAVKKGSYQIFL